MNLDYHISHQVCLKTKNHTHICPACGREFSSNQMCQYHIDHHVCGLDPPKPVVLVAFGQENMEHVTQTVGDIMGQLIVENPKQSISRLFECIHGHSQLPEYHNIYVPTQSPHAYARVYDGYQFQCRPRKSLIRQIVTDTLAQLNRYFDTHNEQMAPYVVRQYESFQATADQLDEHRAIRQQLENEIDVVLLNLEHLAKNK